MRRVFFLTIVLIAYGSLFPFHFVDLDLSHINWWQWLFDFSARTTRGDIVGNVLLFVPLGFFGALSIEQAAYARFWCRIVAYGALILLGFVFALVLQLLQLYLPTRVASASDVLSNFAGLLIGVLASRLAFSRWWSHWLQSDLRAAQVSIPLILCFCWLGYLWFPFLPSYSWQNVTESLRGLTLWHQLTWYGIVDKLVAWSLFWSYLSKITPWQKQWNHRLAILGIILLGQVLVLRNQLSLINCLGALLSLMLFNRLQQLPRKVLAWGLLGWLVLKGLLPLEFTDQLQDFHWLPFASFLQGPLWLYSFVLFEKLFYFGAAFYWLQQVVARDWQAALILASTLFIVEGVQMGLQHRVAEITDPLMALLLSLGLIHIRNLSLRPLNDDSMTKTSV
jgi:glycopeptide antibiotics resistance protein